MLKVPQRNTIGQRTMAFDMTSGSVMDSHGEFKASSVILKSPDKSPTTGGDYPCRQNHVSTVVLHGVPIVSLRIDGRERLCLAQISNTLLKQFSYNEIHNRRVALGITCVQCTPVQLEILRRAGAMPISSRRCGMITKREAERLVKSFLEDNRPPKLPENFYFEVQHKCGWGCKGKFEPSRYNSSRAKCIRCNFCNLYFSPNKFIFHFHRVPESKYNHPDAANFNSWRRHLNLCEGTETDDTTHAWEDVKAMFNGGSRKRVVSSPGYPDEHSTVSSSESKRMKSSSDEDIVSKPTYPNPYQSYPLFAMPGKSTYPFNKICATNTPSFQYQMGKTGFPEEPKPSHGMTYNPWRQTTDFIIPPYDLLWASQFNPRANHVSTFRQHYLGSSPVKVLNADSPLRQSPSETRSSSPSDDDERSCSESSNDKITQQKQYRHSAFRPVGKAFSLDETAICEQKLRTESSDDENRTHASTNDSGELNKGHLDTDDFDVDVEEEEEDADIDRSNEFVGVNQVTSDAAISLKPIESQQENKTAEPCHYPESEPTDEIGEPGSDDCVTSERVKCDGKEQVDSLAKSVDICASPESNSCLEESLELTEEDVSSNNNNRWEPEKSSDLATEPEDINNLTKEELQRLLRSEMNIRRRVEGDIFKIKRGLEDQVNKEKSQRDQISKQLQSMKDALCNELEQERKTRMSMQQKLKEAHDALHNFSCKMFTGGPCGDALDKSPVRQ